MFDPPPGASPNVTWWQGQPYYSCSKGGGSECKTKMGHGRNRCLGLSHYRGAPLIHDRWLEKIAPVINGTNETGYCVCTPYADRFWSPNPADVANATPPSGLAPEDSLWCFTAGCIGGTDACSTLAWPAWAFLYPIVVINLLSGTFAFFAYIRLLAQLCRSGQFKWDAPGTMLVTGVIAGFFFLLVLIEDPVKDGMRSKAYYDNYMRPVGIPVFAFFMISNFTTLALTYVVPRRTKERPGTEDNKGPFHGAPPRRPARKMLC